jgi:hypothetical protein
MRTREIEKIRRRLFGGGGIHRHPGEALLERDVSSAGLRGRCAEPEILLVDEVLAVGDAAFQKNAPARWVVGGRGEPCCS